MNLTLEDCLTFSDNEFMVIEVREDHSKGWLLA